MVNAVIVLISRSKVQTPWTPADLNDNGLPNPGRQWVHSHFTFTVGYKVGNDFRYVTKLNDCKYVYLILWEF